MTDESSRRAADAAAGAADRADEAAQRGSDGVAAGQAAASAAQRAAADPAAAASDLVTAGVSTAEAAGIEQPQEVQQAQDGLSAGSQAVRGAQGVQHDPVGGLLGLIGGAAGIAGAAASGTVQQAASAVSRAAGVAQQAGALASTATSAAGSSAAAGAAPDARAYGNIGQIADAASWPTAATHDDVSMSVEIESLEGIGLGVRSANLNEALNSISHASLQIRCAGSMPEVRTLLRRNCSLTIERGAEIRGFRGIVLHAAMEETVEGALLSVQVSPALSLLSWVVDSRVYQNKTVPEVVEDILRERLQSSGREIRNECQRTYPVHEYLVQYNEPCLAFIHRLLELEGIFYYFDHDDEGGHEVLVLGDNGEVCPAIRSADGGVIPYAEDPGQVPDQEAISAIAFDERVGLTDVVVSGYNWTNPRSEVNGKQVGRADGDPALQYYEHVDGITYHSYDGEKYAEHTAAVHAENVAAILDQARQSWSLKGTVVSAQPGRRIAAITGAPDGLDEPYLIIRQQTHVEATEGATGSLVQSMQCLPTRIPYHPPRRTPTPIVHGLESAVVVGGENDEIHTDQHRRIRIQFHWDRLGKRNEHSSCWIRVAQMWAGDGWGTLFLPRVGMEVIVSFMGGHPHRPVVIGSLYNGANHPPYTTEEEKTKSTIRTNSTPGGGGFNELRFEDTDGGEEIFIHAQKDMNEVILDSHSTSVGGNQTNSVTGDRTHSVEKNETVTITGSQKITISGAEKGDGQDVQGGQLHITGDYQVDTTKTIKMQAPDKVRIDCGGSYFEMTPNQVKIHCGGSTLILEAAQAEVKSNGNSILRLNADAKLLASGAGEVFLDANAMMKDASGSEVHLDSAKAKLSASQGGVVELTSNAAMSGMEATVSGAVKAAVTGATEASLAGGAGSVKAAAAGVDVAGPQVNVTGQGMTNIAGGVVKIN